MNDSCSVLPAHLAADVRKRYQSHAAVAAAQASQASPRGYASSLYLPMERSGHLFLCLKFPVCVNASPFVRERVGMGKKEGINYLKTGVASSLGKHHTYESPANLYHLSTIFL